MSGGDVVPLGKDAVTELHAIFNWAERSSQVRYRSRHDPFARPGRHHCRHREMPPLTGKLGWQLPVSLPLQGVLLFIDEADAFLRRRKGGDGDSSTAEHTRAAINAVLARTGTQVRHWQLLLLATCCVVSTT